MCQNRVKWRWECGLRTWHHNSLRDITLQSASGPSLVQQLVLGSNGREKSRSWGCSHYGAYSGSGSLWEQWCIIPSSAIAESAVPSGAPEQNSGGRWCRWYGLHVFCLSESQPRAVPWMPKAWQAGCCDLQNQRSLINPQGVRCSLVESSTDRWVFVVCVVVWSVGGSLVSEDMTVVAAQSWFQDKTFDDMQDGVWKLWSKVATSSALSPVRRANCSQK